MTTMNASSRPLAVTLAAFQTCCPIPPSTPPEPECNCSSACRPSAKSSIRFCTCSHAPRAAPAKPWTWPATPGATNQATAAKPARMTRKASATHQR